MCVCVCVCVCSGDTVEQSNIGANQAGKCGRILFNCISITDGIKINEQNGSIGIGPLYLQTEFDYSYRKLCRV